MTIPPPWWFWLFPAIQLLGLILIEAEREPLDPHRFIKREWYGWMK